MHTALCLEYSSSLCSQSEGHLLQEAFLDFSRQVLCFLLARSQQAPCHSSCPLVETRSSNLACWVCNICLHRCTVSSTRDALRLSFHWSTLVLSWHLSPSSNGAPTVVQTCRSASSHQGTRGSQSVCVMLRKGPPKGETPFLYFFSTSHAFVEHLLCIEVYGALSMAKTEVVSGHKLTFQSGEQLMLAQICGG